MSGTVHVIGAGVAGMAAAIRLVQHGRQVVIYEASGHAGGRCRSFHDETLGRVIDNGNHLLLAGNKAFRDYTDIIGASDAYTVMAPATFAFLDLETEERWTIAPNAGRIPWWIFDRTRRVPGSSLKDYLAALRCLRASPDETIADIFDTTTTTFKRFWEPLSVAVVNAQPDEASAALFGAVLKETLAAGEAACRPCLMKEGLGATFVDPAVSFLERHGVAFRWSAPVRKLVFDADRLSSMTCDGAEVTFEDDDQIVLAVPTRSAQKLLPGGTVPKGHNAIVNAHFVLPRAMPDPHFVGLIGGTAEWVFVRGDVASVTVSAADSLVQIPREVLAAKIWPEVCSALSIETGNLPRHRIIKDKMATFAQTPANTTLRMETKTRWKNMALAGDWTATGLPATLEGAIRSGFSAAWWAMNGGLET